MNKFNYFIYTLTFLIVISLLSEKVKAATQVSSNTIQDNTGFYVQATAQTYGSITPDNLVEIPSSTGYYATYQVTENVSITGIRNNKYTTGILITTLTFNTQAKLIEANLISNDSTDNVRYYIYQVNNNSLNLLIAFDNFKNANGTSIIGCPTINLKFGYEGTMANITTMNLSTSISISTHYINQLDGVENNALTAMIYSSIMQGVGMSVQDTVTLLEQIRANDLTYYTQIVNHLSTIISNQNLTYNELIAIFNEIDTDFASVQTILDLFPSYRSQVLQYWQDLLNMNAAQSSAAAENESEYADKDNQSSTLLSGMNDLNMPDLGTQSFNILEDTDNTQRGNWFYMLSLITHTSIVTKILLIIVTASIVGFVLYGKN